MGRVRVDVAGNEEFTWNILFLKENFTYFKLKIKEVQLSLNDSSQRLKTLVKLDKYHEWISFSVSLLRFELSNPVKKNRTSSAGILPDTGIAIQSVSCSFFISVIILPVLCRFSASFLMVRSIQRLCSCQRVRLTSFPARSAWQQTRFLSVACTFNAHQRMMFDWRTPQFPHAWAVKYAVKVFDWAVFSALCSGNETRFSVSFVSVLRTLMSGVRLKKPYFHTFGISLRTEC